MKQVGTESGSDLPQKSDAKDNKSKIRLIDLQELGIGKEESAEMRGKFDTIAEDWERPEMDIYDID